MRKIILSILVSLDGFYASPDGGLDWAITEKEHHDYANDLLDTADTLLFGSVTYKIFADYWPTAPRDSSVPVWEADLANKLDPKKKIVFSKSLQKADWNTTILKDVNPDEIKKMKTESNKNIILFGSGHLAQTFTKKGLIDEYHLLVQPVVVNKGIRLFENLDERINLELIEAHTMQKGVVLMKYRQA